MTYQPPTIRWWEPSQAILVALKTNGFLIHDHLTIEEIEAKMKTEVAKDKTFQLRNRP